MSEPDKPAAPVNFVAEVTNQVPGPSCKLCGAAMHPTFHCDSCGSISGCTGPNDVRAGAAVAGRPEKAATAGPGSQNSEGRDEAPAPQVEDWMLEASKEIRQLCLQQAGYLNAALTAEIIAKHCPKGGDAK